jgi:hypothetical protein
MAIDPVRIGEFNLLTASVVAWLGIALVAVLAVLVPEAPQESTGTRVSTVLRRSEGLAGSRSDPGAPAATPDVGPPETPARVGSGPEPQAR